MFITVYTHHVCMITANIVCYFVSAHH